MTFVKIRQLIVGSLQDKNSTIAPLSISCQTGHVYDLQVLQLSSRLLIDFSPLLAYIAPFNTCSQIMWREFSTLKQNCLKFSGKKFADIYP